MEQNIIKILNYLNENRYATASVTLDNTDEILDNCYEHMKQIAKENNCFVEFGGTPYKAEKFYFTWENKLYRWSLVWSLEPYYIFEFITETSHNIFNFQIDDSVAEG